jgi:Uncharacterized conserved protein
MKRLVICCDGTWQDLKSSYPSNIVKLTQGVKPIASDGTPQILFYDSGIGTETKNYEEALPEWELMPIYKMAIDFSVSTMFLEMKSICLDSVVVLIQSEVWQG